MHKMIGQNDVFAYLVMMTARLIEMHRVLKSAGSLFLHCDPTASHYLKIMLDAIFGPINFRNEIVWVRSTAKNDPKRYGRNHDVLLFYSKSGTFTWNKQFLPMGADFADLPPSESKNYTFIEAGTGRRYRHGDLTANKPGGDVDNEWHGVKPYKGRHWAYSRENMDKMMAEGRIEFRRTGMPVFKRYLDEMPGVPLQDVWTDIHLASASPERLGWDTQKPLALLERVIVSSSNEGDIVLDPFCGCGTAVIASQKLGRRWVGIDVTYLAIAVMRARLRDSFGLEDVEVIGQPTEVEGARQLALSPDGRYQFQWWALGMIDAQPLGGVQKKGADKGIDGRITFTDTGGQVESVLVSVKSGHVNSSMIRDLKGTIEREKAAIGIFVTLEEATEAMRLEASTAATYHSHLWNRDYPKIQILTVRDLVEAKRKPELPPFVLPTYQKAQRIKAVAPETQIPLFDKPPVSDAG